MCYYCSRFPVRFRFPVVHDLILVPFLVLVVDTVIIPLVVPLSGERRVSRRGRVFRRPKCATVRPSRPSPVKNSLNYYYSLLRGEYRRKSSSVI